MEILFNNRKKRIHPYKDDKILTDWNALMISAFAKASQAFDNPSYASIAEKAMLFVLKHLAKQNGELLHRYRDGEAGLPAHIDDYAFLIAALLDLYETNFNLEYLQKAVQLNDYIKSHFTDNTSGAFFFTSDQNEELIARQKEIYDGAVPSGNSAAILNLVRLARYTGNIVYENDAVKIINAFAVTINTAPSAYALALCGINFLSGKSMEIVLSGIPDNPVSKELLKVIRETYIPNKVVLFRDKHQTKSYDSLAPFTRNFEAPGHKTLVYVCEGFKCNLPVSSAEELKELLSK